MLAHLECALDVVSKQPLHRYVQGFADRRDLGVGNGPMASFDLRDCGPTDIDPERLKAGRQLELRDPSPGPVPRLSDSGAHDVWHRGLSSRYSPLKMCLKSTLGAILAQSNRVA